MFSVTLIIFRPKFHIWRKIIRSTLRFFLIKFANCTIKQKHAKKYFTNFFQIYHRIWAFSNRIWNAGDIPELAGRLVANLIDSSFWIILSSYTARGGSEIICIQILNYPCWTNLKYAWTRCSFFVQHPRILSQIFAGMVFDSIFRTKTRVIFWPNLHWI